MACMLLTLLSAESVVRGPTLFHSIDLDPWSSAQSIRLLEVAIGVSLGQGYHKTRSHRPHYLLRDRRWSHLVESEALVGTY